MSEMTPHNIEPREWNVLQRRLEQLHTRFKMILGTAIVMAAASVLLWAPFAMSGTSTPTAGAHAPASTTPHGLTESDVQPLNEVRDKQNCYHRYGNYVWVYCASGDYVAGIDFDNNEDNIGGVYCCPL